MKRLKLSFIGFVVVFLSIISFGTAANADVSIQGQTFTDAEYEELLDSIPEGYKIVSDQEFAALSLQRASPYFSRQAHIQSQGWGPVVKGGGISGTVGQAKRLEAIKLTFYGMATTLSYRAHVQSDGWQSWKNSGSIAGTVGQAKRMEAFQVKTDGIYALSYRAHVQSDGWQSWKNSVQSSVAGTTGQKKRIEALEFVLLGPHF